MRFYKIYLEISDICNLNCSFCPSAKAQRGVMPLQLFDKITTQIKNKTHLLSPHILGDPLCVENLSQYLDILEAKNIRLDIVSSGVYLQTSHFATLGRRNVHQVSFSLDSVFDNRLDFESYFDKILRFYEFLQTLPFRIYLNLRLFGSYDISNILRYFKNYEMQPDKRRIRLNKHFFLRFHNKFKWIKDYKNANFLESNLINSKNHNSTNAYCLGSISQLGILSNGVVVPCCIDSKGLLALGDLKIQDFNEVIESRTFKKFKASQLDSKNLSKICQNCNFRGV